MSAIAIEVFLERTSPPTCLIIENPHRLVSLWDMLEFYAASFVECIDQIRSIEITLKQSPQELSSPEGRMATGKFTPWLQNVAALCDRIMLRSCALHARRTLDDWNSGRTNAADFAERIGDLRHRVIDDLRTRYFFSVDEAKAQFFVYDTSDYGSDHMRLKSISEVFGQKAVNRFPEAGADMEDAVKCWVADFRPACVFHLMRIVESAIPRIARLSGNTDPKPSWGSVLSRVEAIAIKTKYQDVPEEIKPHLPFLKEVLPIMQSIQIAWRNKVSHLDGRIVPDRIEGEAELIMGAVRSLMNILAAELPEATRQT